MRNILTQTLTLGATVCALTFVTGCQSTDQASAQASAQPAPVAPVVADVQAPAAPAVAITQGAIRIKAGAYEPFKDSSGNVWQADLGFDGGDVIDRDPELAIENTKDAGLYRSEHYGMNSFSCAVPNGKYLAKLHFAETYDGISGAGERVFSFNVQGREFKDFDVFVKAGGSNRAYIETVPVEVTNGKFTITFTSNVENPEINAIELVPQS
jgi:outer membrane murein-binding lipoprotein Lpp